MWRKTTVGVCCVLGNCVGSEESRERLACRTRPMRVGVRRADYYGVSYYGVQYLACYLDERLLNYFTEY